MKFLSGLTPPSVSALVASLAIVVSVPALPAAAEKTSRAPISYAGGQTATASTPKGDMTRRIEFRYPDQPDRYYSQDGVRADTAPSPVRFSSSASAVDQLKARDYASAKPSAPAPKAASVDPNLTSGAFDARAAARKATVELPMPPLRETPREIAAPLLQPGAMAATVKVVEPVTPVFDETALAIVYEAEFEGLPTANGEVYAATGMTAAHPDLPLPSLLHVVNAANGREVVVRVNDRGPFEDGAGLQLSARAIEALGLSGAGRGSVNLRYLGPAPQSAGAAAPAPRMEPPAAPRTVAADVQRVAYTPSAADGNVYAVQLGAFSDRANAETFYREIMGVMPANIESAEVNGVLWHRVRVGPVKGRAAADTLRERLVAEGFSAARIVAAE